MAEYLSDWCAGIAAGAVEGGYHHYVSRSRAIADDTGFFDYMAVRLDGDKAAGKMFTLNWSFTDIRQRYAMTLRNSALTYLSDTQHAKPAASIALAKATLDRISLHEVTMAQALHDGSVRIEEMRRPSCRSLVCSIRLTRRSAS